MQPHKSQLLRKVRAKRNLEAAWRIIQENARTSKSADVRNEIDRFAEDSTRNLDRLYRALQRGTFLFPPAKGIPIPKGGVKSASRDIRPIVLAPTESRVVQRAILNVLTDLPGLKPYVNNPHSFGGVRKESSGQLAAVPAAIASVLKAIEGGARYVMCADITGFFTRISKSAVSSIVSDAAKDNEFVTFFDKAIHVELSNIAQLRAYKDKFPIEDIGVAQGNSLSPLLGNILLHEFDAEMNDGDCRCVRYIDDFIVLAPTARAAIARMRLARRLLSAFKMELSDAKSSKSPIAVEHGFDFLGIELANGLIRPTPKAQTRMLEGLKREFELSSRAFFAVRADQPIAKGLTLVATLKRVDGMVRGWGKHYKFCNDASLFARIDREIDGLLRSYLGTYSAARQRVSGEQSRALLGVEALSGTKLEPLSWPKKSVS